MKKIKALVCIFIIIVVIIAFENWQNEQLDRCVNAGYTKEYCSVKLGG